MTVMTEVDVTADLRALVESAKRGHRDTLVCLDPDRILVLLADLDRLRHTALSIIGEADAYPGSYGPDFHGVAYQLREALGLPEVAS